MLNLKKQYHFFPKGRSKWKWLIVVPLFALIILMDFYTSWSSNGRLFWSDYILPLLLAITIAAASWHEENEEAGKK